MHFDDIPLASGYLSLLLLISQVLSYTLWPLGCMPGFPVLHYLPEFDQMSIESRMLSKHLIFCCPLILVLLIFPSIRIFSNKLPLHIRRPKYWSFSCSITPSNVYSGLIFFRIDWFDLLAVQGTLKSLLQHHSSKRSVLWCLDFFIVQCSHPYKTTGKTIALTIWTFIGKVMSLLCNMLSRLSLLPLFPHLFAMKWWDWMPWS